jgi:cytochrome bd ubiquinol oxidase subunit I
VLTLVYGVLAVIEVGLIAHFVRRGVTTGDSTPTPVGSSHTPPDDDPPPRADDDVLSFAY